MAISQFGSSKVKQMVSGVTLRWSKFTIKRRNNFSLRSNTEKRSKRKYTKTARMDPELLCHYGESKKQAREDLALVGTMKEKINEKFVNPFRSTNKTDLNIVTGVKAISTDFVNAKSEGIQAMKKGEENEGDAIESPELVTVVQKVRKPAKSQTLIKIYQLQ